MYHYVFDVNVMNKQFLRFYDSLIKDRIYAKLVNDLEISKWNCARNKTHIRVLFVATGGFLSNLSSVKIANTQPTAQINLVIPTSHR